MDPHPTALARRDLLRFCMGASMGTSLSKQNIRLGASTETQLHIFTSRERLRSRLNRTPFPCDRLHTRYARRFCFFAETHPPETRRAENTNSPIDMVYISHSELPKRLIVGFGDRPFMTILPRRILLIHRVRCMTPRSKCRRCTLRAVRHDQIPYSNSAIAPTIAVARDRKHIFCVFSL